MAAPAVGGPTRRSPRCMSSVRPNVPAAERRLHKPQALPPCRNPECWQHPPIPRPGPPECPSRQIELPNRKRYRSRKHRHPKFPSGVPLIFHLGPVRCSPVFSVFVVSSCGRGSLSSSSPESRPPRRCPSRKHSKGPASYQVGLLVRRSLRRAMDARERAYVPAIHAFDRIRLSRRGCPLGQERTLMWSAHALGCCLNNFDKTRHDRRQAFLAIDHGDWPGPNQFLDRKRYDRRRRRGLLEDASRRKG